VTNIMALDQPNRHLADELADVRSELRRLEDREKELRAYLLEHPEDRAGVEYVASVRSCSRSRVDLKALADEIGASLMERFTAYRTALIVRLRERDGG
jgi:hypothetical protein